MPEFRLILRRNFGEFRYTSLQSAQNPDGSLITLLSCDPSILPVEDFFEKCLPVCLTICAMNRTRLALLTAAVSWLLVSGSVRAAEPTADAIEFFEKEVLAKLEEKGLAPAKPADRRSLIRRAYFDLLGLPPTPAEVDAWLSDQSPDAFAKWPPDRSRSARSLVFFLA